MRSCLSFALGAILAAQTSPPPLPDPAQALEALVQQVLKANPEFGALEAQAELARERVPQASALADPVVSLGYQNDGFSKFQIGRMESTFATIMGTQALPWPGKRALRQNLAQSDVGRSELALTRGRLDLEAEVRGALLSWALVQGQLRLLGEQETLFRQAEALAKVRYETGQVPQTDLLRAQLEQTRLQQRRWALEAEPPKLRAGLNRLRAQEPEAELVEPPPLETWPQPARVTASQALAEAELRSPELALARLGIVQSDLRIRLAEKDLRPDLAVSAGIMPRGSLEPMWSVGVSFSVPLFSGSKQRRAVAEHRAHHHSEAHAEEGLRRLLGQRVRERLVDGEVLDRILELFRGGLLAQSEATLQSTLAQYQVGRVGFGAVLEASNGSLGDRAAFLDALAQRHRLSIAQAALSLEPGSGAASTGAKGTASMGSTSARSSAARPSSGDASTPSASPTAMTGM